MAVLTAKTRAALPETAFALPGRAYPIHDEAHARDALSRVAGNGTPEEQAKVRAAVARRYPGIEVSGGKGRTVTAGRKRVRVKEGSASEERREGTTEAAQEGDRPRLPRLRRA